MHVDSKHNVELLGSWGPWGPWGQQGPRGLMGPRVSLTQ